MKLPGRTESTPEDPQQPIEHERLEELFDTRRGVRGIGCGVIVLIVLIGSSLMWTTSRRDYSIRAEVSQGMALGFRVRSAVAEYLRDHGELPANNEEAGLPSPNEVSGDNVSQVGVEDGKVVVVYGNDAHENIAGKKLTLVPDASKSPELSWTCKSLDIPDKWLSSTCRTPR